MAGGSFSALSLELHVFVFLPNCIDRNNKWSWPAEGIVGAGFHVRGGDRSGGPLLTAPTASLWLGWGDVLRTLPKIVQTYFTVSAVTRPVCPPQTSLCAALRAPQ